jgi:hypothetical protein
MEAAPLPRGLVPDGGWGLRKRCASSCCWRSPRWRGRPHPRRRPEVATALGMTSQPRWWNRAGTDRPPSGAPTQKSCAATGRRQAWRSGISAGTAGRRFCAAGWPASWTIGRRAYTDAFEIICCHCGDDPDLVYSAVSSRVQLVRGPYPIMEASAHTRHTSGRMPGLSQGWRRRSLWPKPEAAGHRLLRLTGGVCFASSHREDAAARLEVEAEGVSNELESRFQRPRRHRGSR